MKWGNIGKFLIPGVLLATWMIVAGLKQEQPPWQQEEPVRLKVSSLNEGGGQRSSDNYALANDAVGQDCIGSSSSENYILEAGSVPGM